VTETRAIVTSFIDPPIPVRTHDWCAYRDGDEEGCRYGWGRTKEEAVADLLRYEEERD